MLTEARLHARAAGKREAVLGGLIELARPKDWIKNVFVVAPVPFALATGARLDLKVFVWGLSGFCLINSAIYTLNDWLDAAADRLHPQKRRRPLAAETVPPAAAAAQIAVLLLCGIGLCLATGKLAAVWIALVYIALNVAYSLGAKHVTLLDVFFLSSGFVIRVLLGCALLSAAPSAWLLLCTSALALFLGFAKRRADLMAGVDRNHRPALRQYSQQFLDQAMVICAGVALLSYALYGIESKVLVAGREMASMPFVAYGILNYLRLAITENAGGSPVDIAFTSRSSQLCAVAWAVAVTWSLGLW